MWPSRKSPLSVGRARAPYLFLEYSLASPFPDLHVGNRDNSESRASRSFLGHGRARDDDFRRRFAAPPETARFFLRSNSRRSENCSVRR